MRQASGQSFPSVAGVVCLTASFLLLGMELRRALPGDVSLPAEPMRAFLAAVLVLYVAGAWRLSRGRGWGTTLPALASMVLAHVGLGIALGACYAVVRGEGGSTADVIAEGLYGFPPGLLLQVALAACVALLFEQEARTDWLEQPHAEWVLEASTRQPDVRAQPVSVGAQDRMDTFDGIVSAGASQVQAEGAMLSTSDGLVLASSLRQSLEAERVAAMLPEIVRDARRLEDTPPGRPVVVRVGLSEGELVAVSGEQLTFAAVVSDRAGNHRTATLAERVLAHAERLYRERLPATTVTSSVAGNPTLGAG